MRTILHRLKDSTRRGILNAYLETIIDQDRVPLNEIDSIQSTELEETFFQIFEKNGLASARVREMTTIFHIDGMTLAMVKSLDWVKEF